MDNELSRAAILLGCGVGVVLGLGTTLLLSHIRWFVRPSLRDRLAPFVREIQPAYAKQFEKRSLDLRGIALSWIIDTSDHIARLLGISERLENRLQQANSDDSPQTFRIRQISSSAGAFVIALLLCLATGAGTVIAIIFTLVAAALTFLVLEQSITQRISRNRERLFLELPVVAEQLATLLSAGFSLGAAIRRCSQRNNGLSGQALRQITERMQHGVTMKQALQEWASLMEIPELHQLVAILSLNDDTSELARLVSSHARTLRTEAQRRRIEMIERRGQQVWVPVTVATLVPGVIFLLIPFLQALSLLAGT